MPNTDKKKTKIGEPFSFKIDNVEHFDPVTKELKESVNLDSLQRVKIDDIYYIERFSGKDISYFFPGAATLEEAEKNFAKSFKSDETENPPPGLRFPELFGPKIYKTKLFAKEVRETKPSQITNYQIEKLAETIDVLPLLDDVFGNFDEEDAELVRLGQTKDHIEVNKL